MAKALHKQISAIPKRPIGDLEEGTRVAIIGTASSSGADILAPHSNRRCLACSSKVQTGNTGSQQVSRVTNTASRSARFIIEDSTGKIAVLEDPNAVVDIVEFRVEQGTAAARPPVAKPVEVKETKTTEVVHFYEGILQPKDRVLVIGQIVRTPEGVLCVTGTTEHPVIVSMAPELVGERR
jgi:hypothetical protein